MTRRIERHVALCWPQLRPEAGHNLARSWPRFGHKLATTQARSWPRFGQKLATTQASGWPRVRPGWWGSVLLQDKELAPRVS